MLRLKVDTEVIQNCRVSGGHGGAATVSVSKAASVSSLTLQTTASGGDGGSDRILLSALGRETADLPARRADVLNAGGSVVATANAIGGQVAGGGLGAGGGIGGDGGDGYVGCARHHNWRLFGQSFECRSRRRWRN